ncbi:MAG: uncharacterized protein QOD06_2074 [Candidatus Binatota bacterium]|nr:uncharacterized protein [Candidatus Binatota bacterium]
MRSRRITELRCSEPRFFELRGLALLALALALAGCTRAEGPTVVLQPKNGAPVSVRVELADTPRSQAVGLMYRKEMPEDHGMLFLFDDDSDHGFWMKNTPLPLDMLFISKEGTVAGIVANAVPYSLDLLRVGAPSRFVLEVNGGFALRHGIAAGDRVTYEGIASANVAAGEHRASP